MVSEPSQSKRSIIVILTVVGLFVLSLFLTACGKSKNPCPTLEGQVEPVLTLSDLITMNVEPDPNEESIQVDIGGKMMTVDKLVDYPLCNDDWSGTVYVSCDARVAEAELDAGNNPLFLKGCNLNIAPNTVVYVAAHNNTAYYNGCSCHTGGMPEP